MKENKASTYRLVLPVLLGGLCLLALWAVTARGTRAAPLYTPEVDVSERNAQGCDEGARLNPGGTLVVSGAGLVFCGGSPGASVGTQWGTGGWKAVTLDLNAFQGQNVILYLTLWSREYEEPYYDDRAWFNTWAYVDNVRPHN